MSRQSRIFLVNVGRRIRCLSGLLLLLLATSDMYAQENTLRPKGRFLTDTAEVGRPVQYALSIRHPAELDIYFPDSTFDFSPFEFLNKEVFTTQTDDRGSLDSAVYTLVSFEVSSFKGFRLPIFVQQQAADSVRMYAPYDTLFTNLVVPEVADTTSVRPFLRPFSLPGTINYAYFLFVGLLLVFLLWLIYWFLGERIIQQWELLLMYRRHREFLRTFGKLRKPVLDKMAPQDTEKVLVIWKNYLQRIEQKPYATYTTREIIESIPDEALAEALKEMDRMIYGQVRSANITDDLDVLRQVAVRFYRQKKERLLTPHTN